MSRNYDFQLSLIEEVKKRKCLYVRHSSIKEKDEAWEEIEEVLGEKAEDMRKQWRSIRQLYSERLKWSATRFQKASRHLNECLEFLKPHMGTTRLYSEKEKKGKVTNRHEKLRKLNSDNESIASTLTSTVTSSLNVGNNKDNSAVGDFGNYLEYFDAQRTETIASTSPSTVTSSPYVGDYNDNSAVGTFENQSGYFDAQQTRLLNILNEIDWSSIPLDLTVLKPPMNPDIFEKIVEQACLIGVSKFLPVFAEKSDQKVNDEK